MAEKRLSTQFAPAERADRRTLRRQAEHFTAEQISSHLLDAVPSVLAILNEQRQIVYANKALLAFLQLNDPAAVLGRRSGEAFDCIHAHRTEGGCGTTENCSRCGAVLSILSGLAGQKDIRDCRITRHRDGRTESLDLQIWATPLVFKDERFTVFAVADISNEKRRQALERIFFHDILNIVGSIGGFAELLQTYELEHPEEIYALLRGAADQAIDEIRAQRTLLAAENGELQIEAGLLSSLAVIEQVAKHYRLHSLAEGRQIHIDPAAAEVHFTSDRVLLGRILGNMVKNALEAGRSGETVTLGCALEGDQVAFSVHNPGVMSADAQLQVFQRSFTTKGVGRGLGTYSMQLLSGYLGGEVGFTTSEEAGTRFVGRYPLGVVEEAFISRPS